MDDCAECLEDWKLNLEKSLSSVLSKEEKLKLLLKAFAELDKKPEKFSHAPLDPKFDRLREAEYKHHDFLTRKKFEIIQKVAKKCKLEAEFRKNVYSPHIFQMGSSPKYTPLDYYYCANHLPGDKFCDKEGKLRCSNCLLVAYCSKECQRQHWARHRYVCKSDKASVDFAPKWTRSGNFTKFMNTEVPGKFHLWGTTPAYDVMNWKNNELQNVPKGVLYNEPVNIVFAGSNGFGKMIETLAAVPSNVTSPFRIILHDTDPLVTARNFLKLFLLQTYGSKAVETVIHTWYSTIITEHQFASISYLLEEKLCIDEEKYLSDDGIVEFKKENFKIVLNDAFPITYLLIETIYYAPRDIFTLVDLREQVVENEETSDVRDAYRSYLKFYHRAGWNEYRSCGALLPYGARCGHFSNPNRTIFNMHDVKSWIIPEMADPTDGWPMGKVVEFGKQKGLPTNDLIGCLFYYLRDRLLKVVQLLEKVPVQIEICTGDAGDLPEMFAKKQLMFDRIDVANLCDEKLKGVDEVLKNWVPLINKKNRHAALISLFTDWYDEDDEPSFEDMHKVHSKVGCDLAMKATNMMAFQGNMSMVRGLLDDSDEFKKYLDEELGDEKFGVVARKQHKVVPHRFFAPINASVTYTLNEEELYYAACVSKCSLRERFVEWVIE